MPCVCRQQRDPCDPQPSVLIMQVLKLLSETKAQRETCKGCTFLDGTKANPICKDEGFVISKPAGFAGGCDNPKRVSGVFVYLEVPA